MSAINPTFHVEQSPLPASDMSRRMETGDCPAQRSDPTGSTCWSPQPDPVALVLLLGLLVEGLLGSGNGGAGDRWRTKRTAGAIAAFRRAQDIRHYCFPVLIDVLTRYSGRFWFPTDRGRASSGPSPPDSHPDAVRRNARGHVWTPGVSGSGGILRIPNLADT